MVEFFHLQLERRSKILRRRLHEITTYIKSNDSFYMVWKVESMKFTMCNLKLINLFKKININLFKKFNISLSKIY